MSFKEKAADDAMEKAIMKAFLSVQTDAAKHTENTRYSKYNYWYMRHRQLKIQANRSIKSIAKETKANQFTRKLRNPLEKRGIKTLLVRLGSKEAVIKYYEEKLNSALEQLVDWVTVKSYQDTVQVLHDMGLNDTDLVKVVLELVEAGENMELMYNPISVDELLNGKF